MKIALIGILVTITGGIVSAKSKTSVYKKSDFQAKVIYGEDDRLDYKDVTDVYQRISDSTVTLVRSSRLSDRVDGTIGLDTRNFKSSFGLCEDEPFGTQNTLGFCSGSLIGPDLILTAGHCIKSQSSCESTKFVFDFKVSMENQSSPSSLNQDDVYSCDTLVHTEDNSNGADFAVIKLKREVVGRQALSVKRDRDVKQGDDLVVVGYPSGLPVKIAGGSKVRSVRNGYFVANLDTYGGNSGSAVFDLEKLEVSGVLVRGERDFVFDGGCRRSNYCSDSGCRGEDVTLISKALPFIPEN
ncbi:MAG: serine protease [Bdellovibrionales bacterium]